MTIDDLASQVSSLTSAVLLMQTAISNVATKAQLSSILTTKQADILDLQERMINLETQVAALILQK
jgi:hypothetical protein